MLTVFDVDKLRELLKDFYKISHIRITVFDESLRELVSYPEEVAPYCAVIRGTMKGYEACMDCDRHACEMAAKKHGTHIYRCHAGLTEAVTPLYVGDVLVGFLLFGHVFSYESHEAGQRAVEQHCAALPINRRMLSEALSQANIIEEDYVRSAAHILRAVAATLISERMATLKEDVLAARLDAYLSEHFTEKLSAVSIAKALGIGKTQLYELSHRLYDKGSAERVRDLRMARAKTLLQEQQKLPLSEIAERCGYHDYNYFFTVFSREVGCTPSQWRTGQKKK